MANMNIMPGGGSGRGAEPVTNWWAQDNPLNVQQPAADPLARNRNQLFGASKQNAMVGAPGGASGRQPEGSYYSTQPVGPYSGGMYGSRQQTPPPMQGAPGQMGNPTGYQPMGSGQFSPLQVRANPYMQQSNWYGQAAFNPYMYGGGQGYGMAQQFQNPYAAMQQLQQWRNPYVNNMLSQGYLQQPQQYQYYNRPTMPGMPTMPNLPTFQAWNPYYNAQQGMPPGQLGRDQ